MVDFYVELIRSPRK